MTNLAPNFVPSLKLEARIRKHSPDRVVLRVLEHNRLERKDLIDAALPTAEEEEVSGNQPDTHDYSVDAVHYDPLSSEEISIELPVIEQSVAAVGSNENEGPIVFEVGEVAVDDGEDSRKVVSQEFPVVILAPHDNSVVNQTWGLETLKRGRW